MLFFFDHLIGCIKRVLNFFGTYWMDVYDELKFNLDFLFKGVFGFILEHKLQLECLLMWQNGRIFFPAAACLGQH